MRGFFIAKNDYKGMIDLTKTILPEAVEVNGEYYPVQTSFKYWLQFIELTEKKNTTFKDFDFMYRDKMPADRQQGFSALIQFCNPPQLLPRTETEENSVHVLDYIIDADYIYSAFAEQYPQFDLRRGIHIQTGETIHWYEFQALLHGLHDTKLNEIIGYRSYENKSGKHDTYTRQMEKLKSAWELPQESDEEDEDLKAFEALLRPHE